MMVFFVYLYIQIKMDMKASKYLSVILGLFFFSCGGDGDGSGQKAIIRARIDEVKMYTGSGSGAQEYNIEESERDDIISTYFGNSYDVANPLSSLIIEFNDDRITYIYRDSTANNALRKVVTGYRFEGDSLFALKSDGEKLFVALGTSEDNLYRTNSFFHTKSAAKDTLISINEKLDLNKVLGYAAANGNSMTNAEDIIIWINVTYPFE